MCHPSALWQGLFACAPRRNMLTYIDAAVTRNASEKKINSLLDFMAQAQDIDVLQVKEREGVRGGGQSEW